MNCSRVDRRREELQDVFLMVCEVGLVIAIVFALLSAGFFPLSCVFPAFPCLFSPVSSCSFLSSLGLLCSLLLSSSNLFLLCAFSLLLLLSWHRGEAYPRVCL